MTLSGKPIHRQKDSRSIMSSYSFPADVAALINQHMARGVFPSEDDVLREALHALTQRLNDSEAIRSGIGDLEAGRLRPLQDVANEIRTRHGSAT